MPHNTIIVPFEEWHLGVMNIREEQSDIKAYADDFLGGLDGYGSILISHAAIEIDVQEPCAWTAIIDGRILACAGILRDQSHVGTAWAAFDKDFHECALKDKVVVTKRIKKAVRSVGYQRVQATVLESFEMGCRFLESLGMEEEGLLRKYSYFGQNHKVYSYIGE